MMNHIQYVMAYHLSAIQFTILTTIITGAITKYIDRMNK